ncbi:MAG: beta-N-acetylhexosaminidase [Clostridia bacterium]|nr:beta-N-acetylhexosaminidase [Clostridia bacterium]
MEKSCFDRFGVMIDNSRNAVMNVPSVKKYIDLLAKVGCDFLMLYTEDTYEVNGRPYFGRYRGRYSKSELKELDSYAKSRGVELCPCIQTLAHLNAIMRWPEFSRLADSGDTLCAGDEEVYKLIDDIFATLNECFTSKTVNIGMDEAENIGLGRYLKEHGLENRMDILVRHLKRVSEIAAKYGFNLLMWGDMFYKLTGGPEDKAEFDKKLSESIPANVNLIYWDYYSLDKSHYDSRIRNYRKLQENIWFAGGLWTWTGFTPHISYALKATEEAVKSCIENKVKNVFMTLWGDNGGETSRFSVIPALFAAAEFARGNFDMETVKEKFIGEFGIAFDDFMLAELPDTPNTDNLFINNPEKYMLYSDPFMGILDALADGSENLRYKECADRLCKMTKNGEYGVVFDVPYRISRVMELKFDLGVRTRKAYQSGDVKALKELLPVYDETILRIEDFYTALEKWWMFENKPHGFDVQDIRIGGLLLRMRHCRKRLSDYVSGVIPRIEELEEAELHPFCAKDGGKGAACYNNWALTASCNVL